MTDLEIYNSLLDGQGIIDEYKSLIWERKYFESGAFEIYAPATENNLTLLKAGNIVVKSGAAESGLIDFINIAQGEDGTYITAKGSFLSYILNKRVIRGTVTLTGSVELSMRKLLYDNCINVSEAYKTPFLELGALNNFEETFDAVVSYKDLYEYLTALSKVSGIGFRVRLDAVGKKLLFETYRAADRSIEQTKNPQVIFSQEYDNLHGSEYSLDTTAEVNAVIARYKGNLGEVIAEVGSMTGLNRKEICIEGDCVSYSVNPEEGSSYEALNVSATQTLLRGLAQQNLQGIAENFEGSVVLDGSMIYKTDYDLGDIVTVFNDEWGLSVNSRIYSIQEVSDENGEQVIPVFGSPLPTIMDILKG